MNAGAGRDLSVPIERNEIGIECRDRLHLSAQGIRIKIVFQTTMNDQIQKIFGSFAA
jgi:hypothetical protein